MHKLLLAAGLIAILVLILVLGRTRPYIATQPVASQDEPQDARQPADQLIVAAASADAAIAWSAYRDLKRTGHCPYMPDSPESPVGLLTAAYGDSTSDTSRVLDVIRLLVKQGCDIDQYNASGLTPLHNAVLFRQPDLLRFLLEQQADPLLRIIAIPGKSPGRTLANLDAYGLALTLRVKFPDDVAVDEILKLLKPAA